MTNYNDWRQIEPGSDLTLPGEVRRCLIEKYAQSRDLTCEEALNGLPDDDTHLARTLHAPGIDVDACMNS